MGKQGFALVLLFVGGVALASVLALVVVGSRRTPPEPPGAIVPAFSLADQNGNPIDESALDGRYTVLDFIFTSCPLYCPTMTSEMRKIQDATAGTPLRFLSVSIDGDVDTPERLREWGESFGSDPQRWVFATGPTAMTWSMARSLGFAVSLEQSEIDKADGTRAANINHPTRLLLIGPDRRVVMMASYNQPDEIAALIDRASELAG